MAKKENTKCPRFMLFVDESGTCSAIQHPRGEGTVSGSCDYCGDTEKCLAKSDPEFRDALVLDLLNYSRDLKRQGNYFEQLTRKYTDSPRK